MADVIRELIHLASPISLEVVEEDGLDKAIIKGFASVEKEDRSGDIVPPEEFKIEQFMAAPTLLVNHKHWHDERGNGVAAGRPLELHAARIAKSENDKEWKIVSLKTGEAINTYPKAKVPNLKVGDRGLFVVAEVTQKDVVGMVQRGELSAFSWRGLTEVDYRLNKSTGTTERIFKNIDLFEISLTHVPDNINSTFVVGKSAHMMTLKKSRFESKQMAVAYLDAHSLNTDSMREDDDAYYSQQLPSGSVDVSQLVVMKMADGVDVVVGPLIQPSSWEGRQLKEYGAISKLFESPLTENPISKENAMAEAKATEEVQSDATESTSEVEKKQSTKKEDCGPGQIHDPETGKCVSSKEAEALDALGDHISQKTAAGIVEGMTPLFETMAKSIEGLNTTVTGLVEKMAPGVVEEPKKTETQKSNDSEIFTQMNSMAETLLGLQTELVNVAKSAKAAESTAKAVASSTPPETSREEKLVSKSQNDDPNDMFDSLFPMVQAGA